MKGLTMRTAMPTCALIVMLMASPGRAQAPIDNEMDRVPEVPMAKVAKIFSPKLIGLWTSALDRPDADTKTRAAFTIAQAQERGMPGLGATVPPLMRELDRSGQQPTTLAAIARTLVVLDAKESADRLSKLAAAGDTDLQEVVEPTLAKWDHKSTRAVWLERINQPQPHGRGTLRAIQCLSVVKEEKAAGRLRELALSADEPPQVRLEAARTAGALQTAGSETEAAKLAGSRTLTDRLVAVHLLRHHSGDAAVRQLQKFVRDPEPSVAAVALARLVEIDPKLAFPVLDPAIDSPDANVRGLAVEVLLRTPNDEHINLLSERLNDAHPDVRVKARKALAELAAKPAHRDAVVHVATRSLADKDWRGQEQAALLLAQLGHKPATTRLLALLSSQRPEVGIAAAWALRTLDVPDTLPTVLEFVKNQYERLLALRKGGRLNLPFEAWDRQQSQLVQFLGHARYKPADALLRKFIPRGPLGLETRSAAAWALGLIHEGKPDAGLAKLLEGRLAANTPFDSEAARYRRMCAVALGTMKAKQALPTLKQFFVSNPSVDEVNNACYWAIATINGEKLAPAGVVEINQLGWFLTSLD